MADLLCCARRLSHVTIGSRAPHLQHRVATRLIGVLQDNLVAAEVVNLCSALRSRMDRGHGDEGLGLEFNELGVAGGESEGLSQVISW